MGLASSIAVLAALAATPLSGAGTRVVSLGRSVRHRPIQAEVLGSAQAPRKVVVVGCIHGDECAGVAIVRALARQAPPAGVRLWLVPTLNPDGMAARTRQNADGVDLNRNFPYRWRPLADPVYNSGPRPASEPETRAAMRLIARIRPSVTIWYHQHEDLVDMSGGDRAIARRYARAVGLRATCLPFLPGTATSWSNHALPTTTAFVVELPAGALTIAQVTRNVRAVHGAELGAHLGSRTSCAA